VAESIGTLLIITTFGHWENTQDGSFISAGCYATDFGFLGRSLWIQGRPSDILQLWSYEKLWAKLLQLQRFVYEKVPLRLFDYAACSRVITISELSCGSLAELPH
jgi:hypothetical protein